MNPGKNPVFLRGPEAVDWVKDRDQVLIINKRQRESCVLQGVEALLWGWLASAYSYPKTLRLLGNLSGTSPAEAESNLQIILEKWRLAGLLELEAGEHG